MENLYNILTSKLLQVNTKNLDQYVFSTRFDVKEPESYNRAMQFPNAAQ